MYNANNGVIGNIWRQKVAQSHKESMHPIPQLDEDVYNLFESWSWDLPDNADDINNFIINLKCELGIQQLKDVFDCFYITAAATQSQSLTNWAQPGTYDLTIGNTTGLVFTPLKGWRTIAFGSAGYLNTNFNPYTTTCNFNEKVEIYNPSNESATQSFYKYGGSMGIYVSQMFTAQETIFFYDIGSCYGANGVGNVMSILSHSSVGGQIQCYGARTIMLFPNNPAYGGGSVAASQLQYNAPGLYSFVRTDINSMSYYANGSFNSMYRNNSSTLNMATSSCAGSIIFPGFNISTTGGVTKNRNGSSLRQFAFVFIGSKNIDQAILHNNVNNYLTSINAAVANS